MKSFHIRTSYRYTSKLNVTQIAAKEDEFKSSRPTSSIAVDNRLLENYERLLGAAYQEFENGNKTGTQVKNELLGKVNEILSNILDIKVSSIGNVIQKKGSLFFERENTKDFPYANLSAGEKEVIDLVVDLIVKTPKYNDTVFCIDEPELHLNTKIQRNLLIEIEKLIPNNCQLWIATHSIGFLRALQEELKDKSQILDFSEKNYFQGTHTIQPIALCRKNWQRIFQTALDDLTYLVSPKKIIYCEGKPNPGRGNSEDGLDATVYNYIFSEEFPDMLFVSSGGNNVLKNSTIAIQIINKAFQGVDFLRLKDKDEKTAQERTNFLNENSANRMLIRREIENYLFDKEILEAYCRSSGNTFNESDYNGLVTNIIEQDLKSVQQKIQHLVGDSGNLEEWKKQLKSHIPKGGQIYTELKNCIL